MKVQLILVATVATFLLTVVECGGQTTGEQPELQAAQEASGNVDGAGTVTFKVFQNTQHSMSFQGCSDGANRAITCSETEGGFSCSCELGGETESTFDLTEPPFDGEASTAEIRTQGIALAKTQCGFDLKW